MQGRQAAERTNNQQAQRFAVREKRLTENVLILSTKFFNLSVFVFISRSKEGYSRFKAF